MTYKMSLGLACNLCGECVDVCQANALTIDDELVHDGAKCTWCESCMDICPECAIRIRCED